MCFYKICISWITTNYACFNFEIIFDHDKWVVMIEKAFKEIFLNEITKLLPFYKVSAEILNSKVIGVAKKKDQAMLPNEHLILS